MKRVPRQSAAAVIVAEIAATVATAGKQAFRI
jgi:hypothetical protein